MKKNTLLFVVLMFLAKVYAYDFSAVCETGQTLYYEINSGGNNEVTLVAPGYPSWTGFVRPAGNVVVPEQVQHQGITYTMVKVNGDVFRECPELTSVVIPNTVTYIGALAFYLDAALESVVLPNGLTSIENWTFCGCVSLASVNIPDSLNNISDLAFLHCSSLVSISFPNTLETLGRAAFYECSSLSGDLILPSSLQLIGESCFQLCTGLTGVVIPESLNVIPEAVFLGCSNLSGELVIPNSCTSIGPEAFEGCSSLSSLTIGSSVATIGHSAFMNCTGLEVIHCNTLTLPYTAPIHTHPYYPQDEEHVVFYNVPVDIPVYVNCLAIDQFQTNPHWSQFTNMEGVFLSTPTLTVTVNNSDFGTAELVSLPEDCDNPMAMVRANPYPGHVFGYWKRNGVVVSNTPEYTFKLDHDCVLTACFDYFATVYDSIGYPDHIIGRKFNSENQLTVEYVSDFSYLNGVLDNFYFPDEFYYYTSFSFLEFPSLPSSVTSTYGNGMKASDETPPPVTTETFSYFYEDDHQISYYTHYKGNEYYIESNDQYNCYYNDHRLIQKDTKYFDEYEEEWKLSEQNRYAYENGNKIRIDSAFSGSNLRLSTVTTNQYDEAHRILKSQTDKYGAGGDITSQTMKTYTYTSSNKTDSIVTQVFSEGAWVNSAFAYYVYDFKNRVVEYQTGSWSAENTAWDITKKVLYDFDDEAQKETVSFWKKTDTEWVRDVFSRQSLFHDSQLNEWQKQLNYYADYKVNQFEITMHYNTLEQQFPILSEWYYEIKDDDGNITYQHLEYSADTTINGDKPKVIVRTNHIYDKKGHTEVTHEYIKEQGGKVYWWNKELHEFTTLYDYLAEPGDEWEIKVGTENIVVHVDSVGNFEYQGNVRKVLHVSDAANVFNGDIVAGLGHLTSFFPEKLMHRSSTLEANGLRCYWVGDALLYHHGVEVCDAVHAGGHNVSENFDNDGFSIYPNPTDGTVTIKTMHAPSLQEQTEYRIINLMGQTLMTGIITDQTIDVSALPAGMYYITIGNQTVKLMKQ